MIKRSAPPIFLKQRSSVGFILTTVTLGLFTDLLLYGMVVPILPFILTDRLHIPTQQLQAYTSLLLTSYAGSTLIFSLPAGIICDRLSSRKIPFFTGLLMLLASTLLLWRGQTLWILVLARALQGISAAVVWTVAFVIVRDTVGNDKLGVSMGTVFSFMGLGGMIAPPIGGVVYGKLGNDAVFYLSFGVLALDILMRILMIERKTAEGYGVDYTERTEQNDPEVGEVNNYTPSLSSRTIEPPNENSSLLAQSPVDDDIYKVIQDDDFDSYILPSPIPYHLPPLLYIELTSPRLLAAHLSTLTASTLLAIFDATIPLHAYHLFGLKSFHSGLLFIPLVLPYLFLGPPFGALVDRYGPKPLSTICFLYLFIPLACLGLPHAGSTSEVIKYAVILFFVGPGLTGISSPSLVEMSLVMQKYHLANPELFGENGPYARMFGINSMLYSGGLALGPALAAGLGAVVGYNGLMGVIGGLCVLMGGFCFAYSGGKIGEVGFSKKGKGKGRER